jgi:hypothetical protein
MVEYLETPLSSILLIKISEQEQTEGVNRRDFHADHCPGFEGSAFILNAAGQRTFRPLDLSLPTACRQTGSR